MKQLIHQLMLMFFEFMTSVCFLSYGILLPSVPVIIANAASLLGAMLLIVAKWMFQQQTEEEAVADTKVMDTI